jgi:2-polyprenyl-3-methyl-5-hydroxy-6-metoxy-1,4-benzoquinol methylase
MLDFVNRYKGLELLDADNIPTKDLYVNLQELNTINHVLGGHKITLAGFKKLIENQNAKHYVIAEIGCGGGDNMKVIAKYCEQQNIDCSFIGIDMKQDCIDYAQSQWLSKLPVRWICKPYQNALGNETVDIIFNSLFCHHFSDNDIVEMLHWMKLKTNIGFFINDLHRHWLAYYFIKLTTKLFSKSYLVKNDAPISVARGFVKAEWKKLLNKANIIENVNWMWAFRHLIIVKNNA